MQLGIPEAVFIEKSRREKLRRIAKSSLLNFVQFTKPDYEVNWHHEVIASALDAWLFGGDQKKNLILVAPPRHGKSELVSRRLPPYLFGRRPGVKFLACSYGQDLSDALSRDVMHIMDDERYQMLWPAVKRWQPGMGHLKSKKQTVREWHLLHHAGRYICAGVGGAITGYGFDVAVVDDPIKNQAEALSQTHRDKVWQWLWSDLWTRRAPGARLCLMTTRWHEDDVVGRMQQEPGFQLNWKVLHFPAEMPARQGKERKAAVTRKDRRKKGEYLWPDRFGKEELAPLKRHKRIWAAKYQGKPTTDDGNIIARDWITRYSALPLEGFATFLLSVDCAFKDTKSSSRVCISLYGQRHAPHEANIYLLDQICDHLSFTNTIKAIKRIMRRWPQELADAVKLVEDKANGTAVIDVMTQRIPGMVPYTPRESKFARLVSCQPLFEAGNIHYPKDSFRVLGDNPAEWIEDHIDEVCGFPFAAYNDRVDCESQALNYLVHSAFRLRFGRPDSDDSRPANGAQNGKDRIRGTAETARLKPWQRNQPAFDPQSTGFGDTPWELFGIS